MSIIETVIMNIAEAYPLWLCFTHGRVSCKRLSNSVFPAPFESKVQCGKRNNKTLELSSCCPN